MGCLSSLAAWMRFTFVSDAFVPIIWIDFVFIILSCHLYKVTICYSLKFVHNAPLLCPEVLFLFVLGATPRGAHQTVKHQGSSLGPPRERKARTHL